MALPSPLGGTSSFFYAKALPAPFVAISVAFTEALSSKAPDKALLLIRHHLWSPRPYTNKLERFNFDKLVEQQGTADHVTLL